MAKIHDIIFFEDYGLYYECKKEATKRGIKVGEIIALFVAEKVGNKNGYKTVEELYGVCEENKNKMTVAEFIEMCCREGTGKKLGFFELPRA